MVTLRLGTRGSALALVQARTVAALLLERTGTGCEIVVIKTSGDKMADARLSEIGGKGLFVKEIEEALLAGTIDLAVHSSKDMPALIPPGLEVRATLPREDPRDALVLPAPAGSIPFDEAVRRLGAAPRVGTSSVRRVAQLTALLPQAQFVPFRGNLDTRLRKLDQGDVDAITGDDTVLAGLAAQDPYAVVLKDKPFTSEPYGIGVNKDHVDLVRFINGVLEKMRSDGAWENSYRTWLAPTLGKSPGQPRPEYGRQP